MPKEQIRTDSVRRNTDTTCHTYVYFSSIHTRVAQSIRSTRAAQSMHARRARQYCLRHMQCPRTHLVIVSAPPQSARKVSEPDRYGRGWRAGQLVGLQRQRHAQTELVASPSPKCRCNSAPRSHALLSALQSSCIKPGISVALPHLFDTHVSASASPNKSWRTLEPGHHPIVLEAPHTTPSLALFNHSYLSTHNLLSKQCFLLTLISRTDVAP